MEGEEGVPAREVGPLHPSAPSEGPGMKSMQQDSQYGDIEDDATHQQGHDHPEGEDEDGSSEAGSEDEGGLVFGHSDQPLPTSECERKKQRISCLECSQAKTLCDKEYPCTRCVKRGTVCVERFRLVRVPPQPGEKKKYKKKKGKRKFTPVIKPRKSAPKVAKVGYGAGEPAPGAAALAGAPPAGPALLHPSARPIAPAFHKDLAPRMSYTRPLMSGPSYPRAPASYPYPSYPPYPRGSLAPPDDASSAPSPTDAMPLPMRRLGQPLPVGPGHPPGPPPFATSQYPTHLQTWEAPYNGPHMHPQAGPYPAWHPASRGHAGYPTHHFPPSQPYSRMDMSHDGGMEPRQSQGQDDASYPVEGAARKSKRPLSALVGGPRPQEEEEGASAMLMMATVAATRVKLGSAEDRGGGEGRKQREPASEPRATAMQVHPKTEQDSDNDKGRSDNDDEEEDDEDEEEGRGEEKGEDEEEGTAMDTMSHATVGADSATIENADCATLAGGELGADDECTTIPIERLRRDCDALADSVAKELDSLRGRDRENKALLEQERNKIHKLQVELKSSKADEARSASALEAERKLRMIYEEKLRVVEEKQAELLVQLEAEKKRADLSQEEAAAAKEEVLKLQKHIRAVLWQEEGKGHQATCPL